MKVTEFKNLGDYRFLLTNKKDEFREKYDVTTLGLYGSYARDEAMEASDVDIAPKRILCMYKEENMICISMTLECIERCWLYSNEILEEFLSSPYYRHLGYLR